MSQRQARAQGAPSGSFPGLSIRQPAEALESVAAATGHMRLLVAARDLEVTEVRLEAGARMFLTPTAANEPATEVYFLLEGQLECAFETGSVQLEAGASVATDALTSNVTLTALSEIRLLYLSSKPFFHQISRTVDDLMRLATEVELKDGYTADHCERLQRLSYATGKVLGLSTHDLYRLNYGSYLHDVGKVKVPLAILQKPSALDDAEWAVIQRHPSFGRELLMPTFMDVAAPVVEQHHERLDGSGYPFGLAGDDILAEAYIVAVADTYDAMTTDRPYRKALPREVAFAELEKYADIHYPRDIVTAFREAALEAEKQAVDV